MCRKSIILACILTLLGWIGNAFAPVPPDGAFDGKTTHTYTKEGVYGVAALKSGPDLIITDFWEEIGFIHYQIRNIGDQNAPAGHLTALYVDGQEVDSEYITQILSPGKRLKSSFGKYYWNCIPLEDKVTVVADNKFVIVETDETNNNREEFWKCDNDPPVITTSPTVSKITQTSAGISWLTDEDSSGVVKYSRYAGIYDKQISSAQMTTEHTVKLDGLDPSAVYQFVAESTDSAGNTVTNKPGYLHTLAMADTKRPVVSELVIERQETDPVYYRMAAGALDNVGVEWVEFCIDGEPIHRDYSVPFECALLPGELGMSLEEFFERHTVNVVAGDVAGSLSDIWSGLFEPPYECVDIDAEFRWPRPGDTLYIPGSRVPAGTMEPIEVYAAVVEMDCFESLARDPYTGERTLVCDEEEISPVQEVRFYVNTFCIDTVYPPPPDEIPYDFRHRYSTDWNVSNYPAGVHTIRVDAVANDECIQTIKRDFRIETGEPSLDLTRRITRIGNYFEIELTVTNDGTAPYRCDEIIDNVDYMQPIAKSTPSYEVIPQTSIDSRHCDVAIDVYSTSGDPWVEIPRRRGTLTVEYLAVPARVGATFRTDYAVGADPVHVYGASGFDPWEFDRPCVTTEDGGRLSDEINRAIEASDYLIVTSPEQLQAQFVSADDVLSKMAKLARRRNGTLGYIPRPTGIPGSAVGDEVLVKEYIRLWGSTMKGSNGVDGDYLSKGYLLLVGETEIIPAWSVLIPDRQVAPLSDLPYADTIGADSVPDLIVGRIIGNSASDLIRPIEASIEVADGAGFDRSCGLVTSGSEDDDDDFVLDASAMQTVLREQMPGGEGAFALHWSKWIHKERVSMEAGGFNLPLAQNDGFLLADVDGDGAIEVVVVDDSSDDASVYEYSDLDATLSTALSSFDCHFTPHDGLAAGDIDGDRVDEIIVATHESDTISIFNDTRHTAGDSFPEFSVDFDQWDVVAAGDLWGDDKDEIVLATREDYGTVYIYSYETGGTYPELTLRDTLEFIPFTAWDGFGVGNVSGDVTSKDEIIVANDSTNLIYIHNAVGAEIGQIDADPFTPYDGLAVGDVDGDGRDEFATIIDDEVDGKKRLFIFQDNGWYWDSTDDVWKIHDRHRSKLYSRFLDFDGIRTTASDTMYDGFAIGDIDGDGHAEIVVAREDPDKLEVLDGNYSAGWKSRFLDTLRGIPPADVDVFALSGHGGYNKCSPFNRADILSLDFTAHPVIYVVSCWTGNYEAEWVTTYDDGTEDYGPLDDDGFAEAFFQSGAGAYIGSTRGVRLSRGSVAGQGLLDSWEPDQTVGEALTEYKRDRAGHGEGWRCWVTKNNLYGDPKFGAVSGTVAAASPAQAVKKMEPPPSTLDVSIPQYEVKTAGDNDYVDIPGGDVLIEEGQPRVPSYVLKIYCGAEYRVQDVELVKKSNLSTATGLNLPIVDMTPASWNGFQGEAAPAGNGWGWYPIKDYEWRVIPNGDGSSSLLVIIYPFFYNSLTTNVRFYQDYTFNIDYLDSSVSIRRLITDQYVYELKDTVNVEIGIDNTGDTQDVIVNTSVKRYGNDEFIDGLLLRMLRDVAGPASFGCEWDSNGFDPGYYYIEVTLNDPAGQVLESRSEMFRLGASSVEITAFSVTPDDAQADDDVAIDMKLTNTGATNITGTARVVILDLDGVVVDQFQHFIAGLEPLESASFSDTWNVPATAYYRVTGYVLYDSKATEPIVVEINNRVTGKLEGDSNSDCYVNFENFINLSQLWLEEECGV